MKKSELDQFYTKPEVANHCFKIFKDMVSNLHLDYWLEPSAGTGSFYYLLPSNKIGIDLEPYGAGITHQDFFEFLPENNKSYYVIGNPPFGKNASLAIKFFNKAAQFATIIGFIVPKSFRKISIQNKLDLNFVLKKDISLPSDSFILLGDSENINYSVEVCFQIWERTFNIREIKKPQTKHKDFDWTTPDLADFSLRRVGVNAGKSSLDLSFSPSSNYFIKSNISDLYTVFSKLESLFKETAKNTAANPSLSKTEVVEIYSDYRDQHQNI